MTWRDNSKGKQQTQRSDSERPTEAETNRGAGNRRAAPRPDGRLLLPPNRRPPQDTRGSGSRKETKRKGWQPNKSSYNKLTYSWTKKDVT
jgi:hypothetical protein